MQFVLSRFLENILVHNWTALSPLDALTLALALIAIWLAYYYQVTSIQQFSRSIFYLSTVFWVWAVYNTIHIAFDLGIFSYLLVDIATYLHWRMPDRGASVVFTHFAIGFLLFNYILGVLNGHINFRRRDFTVYCVINLGFWAVVYSKY